MIETSDNLDATSSAQNAGAQANPTLAQRVLDNLLFEAAFGGFSTASLNKAAKDAGVDAGPLSLIFPNGIRSALSMWLGQADAAMIAAANAAPGGIFARTKAALLARWQFIAPHKEAARRASLRLALPDMADLALEHGWHSADGLWRALGDTATDFNHYSKRALMMGLLASSFAAFLDDESADLSKVNAAIDAYFDKIKAIDAAKKKLADLPKPDIVGLLARLRYGPQPKL